MPGSFLSETDRTELNAFPKTISLSDLNHYFRLSPRDKQAAKEQHGAVNKLGFALQLCTLRFLGWCPKEWGELPEEVVSYLAQQLKVAPELLEKYGKRENTRLNHFRKIKAYLGFKEVKPQESQELEKWLLARAKEHDAPSVLFRELTNQLYFKKLVRPGVTILEGMVVRVREAARKHHFESLQPFLTPERKQLLDSLLDPAEGLRTSRLEWLRRHPTSDTSKAILDCLEKLAFVRKLGVDQWDLSAINPNRRRQLASLTRHSASQALKATSEERRYVMLSCFVHARLAELIDESLDLFDLYLAGAYRRAGRQLDEFRRQVASKTNQKVYYFGLMGRVVLDQSVSNEQLRHQIYQNLSEEELRVAVEESEQLVRPLDDTYFDYLARSFGVLRQFTPQLLKALVFHSNPSNQPLLQAVELLKNLNQQHQQAVEQALQKAQEQQAQAQESEAGAEKRASGSASGEGEAGAAHSGTAKSANTLSVPYIALEPIPASAPQSFINEKWRAYVYQTQKQTEPTTGTTVSASALGATVTVVGSTPENTAQIAPESVKLKKARTKAQAKSEPSPINRLYYELCVLWELRQALRAGNVWVEGSRRYARLESYLIPKEQWQAQRKEYVELLGLPLSGETRLSEKEAELTGWLKEAEKLLTKSPRRAKAKKAGLKDQKQAKVKEGTGQEPASPQTLEIYTDDSKIWLEDGCLHVAKLDKQVLPAGVEELGQQLGKLLPWLDLPELVAEVDHLTKFSEVLTHAGSGEPVEETDLSQLYAAILAQATNVGLSAMSRMSGFSRGKLSWLTKWYLGEDTLQEAINRLVNYHYHQPLAQLWGDGTFSSSDGQRFVVSVKTANAQALPRYFGLGRGLSYYTWTSDQLSQFATKVVPPTMREATFTLDALLDNESDLILYEHTTDTAGYTELLFGLFDLLGFAFAPRIRDLSRQQLYRMGSLKSYPQLKTLIKRTIKQSGIVEQWEEILRLVASLKLGWVSASLVISKLQSYPRQNSLSAVLQEYGRLCKSIFVLHYAVEEAYRHRLETQLNKGEHLHAVRDQFFIGFGRQLRKRQLSEQNNQASCTNLVVNSIVVWNTLYLQKGVSYLKEQGAEIKDAQLSHIWPTRTAHLNVYGQYHFRMEQTRQREGLRDLRIGLGASELELEEEQAS